MRTYKEIIHIDKRFQNSINLQLDLKNKRKIDSYIPTKSSVIVLDKYLGHIQNNNDKANILIGPYGKGKSHLLLILLYLLSGEKGKSTDLLIDKIKQCNIKTAKIAEETLSKKFLPVIVSGTYKDLNHAFLAGLSDALNREGLQDIAPESYYSVAIKTIKMWQKDYKSSFDLLESILKEKQTNAEEIVEALKKSNENALDLFKSIFPRITAGSIFNPMVEIEAVKLYKEIVRKLSREKNYSGIYIIFDEFSKYIEGHDRETFSRDMKILQDMCELAASSSKEAQIHITFVAHKSIKEYGKYLSKDIINAFQGVEGRIKEERFIVSVKNNYELIKYVLGKSRDDYSEIVKENKVYDEIIEESYGVPCFSGAFDKAEYDELVSYGAFPLLPLTAYCLLSISEKVGQNERSIFTFLANDEQGSMVRLIEQGKTEFGVDVIYNYFDKIFRKNKELPVVHNEWLKAEYALSKINTKDEEKIIKTIAILRMINQNEELPINKNSIRLASGITKAEFQQSMNSLEENNIIIYRRRQGTYAFRNNVGVDIDNEIKKEVNKQNKKINLIDILNEISELDYIFPKQYNQEYTMTRYFRYIYMTKEMFFEIKKAEYLFEMYPADGLILCIVCNEDMSKKDFDHIQKHLSNLHDSRIVLLLPKKAFYPENVVRRLLAVRSLLNNQEFVEENKVLMQELKLYEDDLNFEINSIIENIYLPETDNCFIVCEGEKITCKTEKEFNRFISSLCKRYYKKSPKINNELINRKNVSVQIKKARKQIVTDIINDEDYSKYDKGTSSEATIFRATMVHTGLVEPNDEKVDEGIISLNDTIDIFIKESAGRKNSFSKLYSLLEGGQLGARRGVIPIFLARRISLLQDTPVIYLGEKEVEIQSDIFENINDKPENYYLYIEKESISKEKYLDSLEEIFVQSTRGIQHKRNRLMNITISMQKWYRSLPQYTLNCKDGIPKYYCMFRNLFKNVELNPREVLYEKIPSIFDKNTQESLNYDNYSRKINEIVSFFDNFLENKKTELAKEIKTVFSAKENESMKAVLKSWYAKQSNKAKSHILNDTVTSFMGYIENLNTNDESEIVSAISKIIFGMYIDDWNDTSYEKFMNDLKETKSYIEEIKEEIKEESGEHKISFTSSNGTIVEKYYETDSDDSTSYFFENAIEDALEEFGDSLEVNQKISVLVKTIEKLIK